MEFLGPAIRETWKGLGLCLPHTPSILTASGGRQPYPPTRAVAPVVAGPEKFSLRNDDVPRTLSTP